VIKAFATAAWLRLLRSGGPILPLSALRRWSLRAQGYAVGGDVYIGEGLLISDELRRDRKERLIIGDRVAIAQRVTIVLSSHANNSVVANVMGEDRRPVRIGNDAWIGTGAIILPGVDIGDAAVVGAGAVVTQSVSPRSIVAGNPARLIRTLDEARAAGASAAR